MEYLLRVNRPESVANIPFLLVEVTTPNDIEPSETNYHIHDVGDADAQDANELGHYAVAEDYSVLGVGRVHVLLSTLVINCITYSPDYF